jgi:hypothetical protein
MYHSASLCAEYSAANCASFFHQNKAVAAPAPTTESYLSLARRNTGQILFRTTIRDSNEGASVDLRCACV